MLHEQARLLKRLAHVPDGTGELLGLAVIDREDREAIGAALEEIERLRRLVDHRIDSASRLGADLGNLRVGLGKLVEASGGNPEDMSDADMLMWIELAMKEARRRAGRG